MTETAARPMPSARQVLRTCLAALLLVCGFAPAHEGHDETPAARAAAPGLAPRLAAASPDLELLAVWQQGKLLIYLDRYATNEPVSGASIELESGANRATAAPAGEGAYQVSAPWVAGPGKYPLVFTVQAKDVADLLNGTLELPDRVAAADGAHTHEVGARSRRGERWIWEIAAAAIVLLLAAIWVVRRRNKEGRA